MSYHNRYGSDVVKGPISRGLKISDLIISEDNTDQILIDYE